MCEVFKHYHLNTEPAQMHVDMYSHYVEVIVIIKQS